MNDEDELFKTAAQPERFEFDDDEQDAHQQFQPDKARLIMLAGGGSGGHLSPLQAVAHQLKRRDPTVKVAIVGQKNEHIAELVDPDVVDRTFEITAGKFRRYHGESFVSHLLDVKTIALNIRDFFRFIIGTAQAWRLLGKHRPHVIMLKGGFVCVPVGIAARLRKIPYITHDSDAIPGLANRITAKHARYNTVAMPIDIYPYEKGKVVQVGIPLRPEFEKVNATTQAEFKKSLEINPKDYVLSCFGGGLGAQNLNVALVDVSKELLESYPNLEIIHFTGKHLFKETKDLYHKTLSEKLYNRVKLVDFHTELHKFSGAADVIVSRAGATNIAEFATQGKACIFVPGAQLTGGQQVHNAKVLEENDAAIIVEDDDTTSLRHSIHHVLDSEHKRRHLSENITKLAYKNSANKIAEILDEIAT